MQYRVAFQTWVAYWRGKAKYQVLIQRGKGDYLKEFVQQKEALNRMITVVLLFCMVTASHEDR